MSALLGALAAFGIAVAIALGAAALAAGLIVLGYVVFATFVGSGHGF